MVDIYVTFSKPLDSYCEAMSLQFSVNSKSSGTVGSSRAQLNDISFTKGQDSLTDKLWRHCTLGTIFGAVWIEYYRDADSDYPYYTYTLKDAMISAVHSSGRIESISLNFASVKGST